MQKCCTSGFRWEGEPVGHEEKLGDLDVYVTGNDTERAILICHDALGWRLRNTRQLADHFAREVGATVYVPDFFHGWSVDEKDVSIYVNDSGAVQFDTNPDFSWGEWFQKNNVPLRLPEVVDCARSLRQRYAKLAGVGHCWGGLMGFHMAGKEHAALFDCWSIAHPAAPEEEVLRQIAVPFQIIAPEHDPTFSQENKELCNKIIPTLGIDYHYQHFPGVVHGFTTKCDEKDKEQCRARDLAKSAVVYWCRTHM